jgi:uncharacterized membrane protein (Fun14 family)
MVAVGVGVTVGVIVPVGVTVTVGVIVTVGVVVTVPVIVLWKPTTLRVNWLRFTSLLGPKEATRPSAKTILAPESSPVRTRYSVVMFA